MTITTEYEATLAVCSEHPFAVVKELAQIEAMGGLQLGPRKTRSIRDVYFDTPEGELSTRHAVLRIRRIDREWRIALKGPSSATGRALVSRSELELPWSQKALERIEIELATYGLSVDWAEFSPDNPRATLLESGFRAIQDRSVQRMVRDIIPEGTRVRAGEMLIDSVTYRLADGDIIHHEIEVEAGNVHFVDTVELLVTHLGARFGRALRPWDCGKLVTGRAVEELLRLDFLEHSVDDHGCLLPRAYDIICSYLRCSP